MMPLRAVETLDSHDAPVMTMVIDNPDDNDDARRQSNVRFFFFWFFSLFFWLP